MDEQPDRPTDSNSGQPISPVGNDAKSVVLFQRFIDGDEEAAEEVFHRYVQRLTQLARSRLSARLSARLDPDDVVMSAYRSFFVGARRGRFLIERGGDLWRVLVEITLHKLYRQVTHHSAQRRSVRREVSSVADADGIPTISKEPTPEIVAAATDELERILLELPPLARTALEMRLQGEDLQEIASALKRNERTVRRLLEQAKDTMLRRQSDALNDPPREPSKSTRARNTARGRRILSDAGLKSTNRVFRQLDPSAPLAFNDIILHEQLGAGATGKVYRATQKSLNRPVAVKYLRKSCLRNTAVVTRFVTEARTVASLNHLGIVGVHGLGQTPNGGYFIVMDLIEGGDLAQRLQSGSVPVADAVQWLIEAAEAISHAHDHGVIHCDLKPSNLMLNKDGHILVTDFGFSRRASTVADATTGIAGTPAFMAPEQIEPEYGPIGVHTDVYGLGAVLFTLLTGRAPFTGSRAIEVLAKIVAGCPPEWPTRCLEQLPKSLVALCDTCLSKPIRSRIGSAGKLIEQLRQLG